MRRPSFAVILFFALAGLAYAPAPARADDQAATPLVVVPVEPPPVAPLPGIQPRPSGKHLVLRYRAGAAILSAGAGTVATFLRLLYNRQRSLDAGSFGARHDAHRAHPANRN